MIVTTHSDILVDALSEWPESIIVCEKHDGRTNMSRLDRSELAHWLESTAWESCGPVESWEECGGERTPLH